MLADSVVIGSGVITILVILVLILAIIYFLRRL